MKKPNYETVETLKDLLRRAEEGEVQGLAYVTVNLDHTIATGWCGSFNDNIFMALGSIENLRLRYYFQYVEQSNGH